MTEIRLTSEDMLSRAAARVQSERRGRWLIRTGCLPVALLFTCVALLFLNTIPFLDSTSIGGGIADLNAFLIGRRLLVSLQTLLLIQLAGVWVLGLAASVAGTRAAAGQGATVRTRLVVWRKRNLYLAWAVLSIRLLALVVLVLALIYVLTANFSLSTGTDLESAQGLWLAVRNMPLVAGLSSFVFMIHWLFGPFLRLRYSLALGALAATWSRRPDERFWLAVSVRLGAGMVGALAALWGASMIRLLYYAVSNPTSNQSYPAFQAIPSLSTTVSVNDGFSGLMAAAAIILGIHTIGQIALPPLYLALTRLRLARQRTVESRTFAVPRRDRQRAATAGADHLSEASKESS